MKKTDAGQVVYIHPRTPMFEPSIIPFSLPALIKRIPAKVIGYSHSEIKDNVIKDARIVIIDIHWYLSLRGAVTLAQRIRSLNPKAKIIAGGITAAEYARILTDRFDIDYVIRGDAEVPLPALVKALLDKSQDIGSIPNLIGKEGFQSPWDYCLNQEDLDENEYYDIDFFPAFKARIKSIHKSNRRWPIAVYPYIMPSRGCQRDCNSCAGTPEEQMKLFRRGVVVRSPDRLLADFNKLDSDPGINFVNIINDFITMLPEKYSRSVLKKRFNLRIAYYFASAPSIELLDLLLEHFRGGVLYFSADKKHLTSSELNKPEFIIKLINRVKKTGNFTPVLNYNSLFASHDGAYLEFIRYVYRHTKSLLVDHACWWMNFPRPDVDGYCDSSNLYKFMYYRAPLKLRMINYLQQIANEIIRAAPPRLALEMRKLCYRAWQIIY